MVSRYRRLAESLKQKFRISPSTRFKPTNSGRNERMLEELGAFSLQFRKMQALVDVHRQAVVKTCARSRGFINAKAPKQYTNGPVGSSVISISQDLSYDSNAVDIMSTLAEQLDEKLHVEITLPIEKWLDALKDAQKQMATLDRARLDADTCKREVLKLESKITTNTGTPRPTLRVPAQANGTPEPDTRPPPTWNQAQSEQARQRLQRKRAKLDSVLQLYEQEEQALNDRLVALAQRCSKDLQEYQHQLYRLVSDFYRNTAEVILPTPAGSSKEFLRRATEKIQSSHPPAMSSRASTYADDTPSSAVYAPRLVDAPGPPSYPSSKLSTAPPDILILDDAPATRSAPSPATRLPATRSAHSPASSFKGSSGAASSSHLAPRASLPLPKAASLGSKDRPQSMLARAKPPAPLSIPPGAAAAAAAAAALSNGSPSPSTSADHLQPSDPYHPQAIPLGHAAAGAPADYPPIRPASTRSSPINGSPLQPASPAAALQSLPHQAMAPPATSSRGPGSAGRGSDAGSAPSDAELMQQHQRVTQLMHAAQAKEAAGDMQSAAMLQSHAVHQAAALRHGMALRNAAAAAAGDPGGPGQVAPASSRPTSRGVDPDMQAAQAQAARQQQANAAAAAAVAAAAAAAQQQQQPQHLGSGPASASAPAALAGAAAAGGGGGADMLEVQRQRVNALMMAANTKRTQGDVATANRLHAVAMQQALLLKAAVERQQQQQSMHTAQHAGGTPRGNDSDAVPDVADAAARRDALLVQQQLQARLHAQHAAAAAKQHQHAHQQHQHAHQHPHAVIAAAAAAASAGRPGVPGVHMPHFEEDDEEDEDDELDGGDTDGSAGWEEPGPSYGYPAVHGGQGPAMDSFTPPPPGLQWA